MLSRGLIDVLPDEASLAAMLAKEIGYILTTHKKEDTRFAFYDRLQFDDKKMFKHFDFERKPEEDAAASVKAEDLLKNSPYKDQLDTAEMFMAELQERARQIPNLISPRVGDAGLLKLSVAAKTGEEESARHRRRGIRKTYRCAAPRGTSQDGSVGRFPGTAEGQDRGNRRGPRENAV